ncbi:hypothetical protein [Sediminitomix flava]|nr:hypothetical protein [Sediminitomix flava]
MKKTVLLAIFSLLSIMSFAQVKGFNKSYIANGEAQNRKVEFHRQKASVKRCVVKLAPNNRDMTIKVGDQDYSLDNLKYIGKKGNQNYHMYKSPNGGLIYCDKQLREFRSAKLLIVQKKFTARKQVILVRS